MVLECPLLRESFVRRLRRHGATAANADKRQLLLETNHLKLILPQSKVVFFPKVSHMLQKFLLLSQTAKKPESGRKKKLKIKFKVGSDVFHEDEL